MTMWESYWQFINVKSEINILHIKITGSDTKKKKTLQNYNNQF